MIERAPSEELALALGIDGGIAAAVLATAGARLRPTEDEMAAPQAYCVKCKTKREMKDATQITMKNGRPATEGKCSHCGTKMFKIGTA